MGVPLLFTTSQAAVVVVPYPGSFPGGEVFPDPQTWPKEGPTLQLTGSPVGIATASVTVPVTPGAITFNAAPPVLTGGALVVVVVPGSITFSGTPPTTTGGGLSGFAPSIRELPPLRLSHGIVTPTGRHYRWGEDEPNPANVPSGVRFSDTMPGGFESADAHLPRKPSIDYADMERLSTWTIYGAGGEVAGEYRLERAAKASGSQLSVSPGAVGYQAALDDDKSAHEIYLDVSHDRWQGPSSTRKVALDSAGYGYSDPSSSDGGVETTITGSWDIPQTAEAWYDAGGLPLSSLVFGWQRSEWINVLDPHWVWSAYLLDDGNASAFDVTANLVAAGPGSGVIAATTSTRKWALLQFYYNGAATGIDGRVHTVTWQPLVMGQHGLSLVSGGSYNGLLASDVVAHAVGKYAPTLNLTKGANGTVTPSGFVIPHLAFHDRTTASEIVKQATKFGLQDWAVWQDKTFWWYERGTRGRHWRTRVGPSQLEETGPQIDRLWNSVIVQYTDVDGTTKTVGPPGSGANVISTDLNDPDPDNPATKAGVTRRDLLQMQTSTAAAATETGRKFLEQQKLLDQSGRCQIVGHVEDDRGVKHPYWAVRAGDTITFVDSSDPSPRRVVKSDKDHSSRTCSVDLDAPPEGLAALLERLGVTLVSLGL